jgi:uncharacterized protein (TIGR02246 family)
MRALIAALFLLSLTSLPSLAQTPADEATHNELRALRDGILDAMSKGDVERELTYFHPNVVVTWHNAEVSRGRDGVRKYLRRMLEGPHRKVDRFNADVNVDALTVLYGDDTGISYGSAVEHFTLKGGRELALPARWSATLVKDGNRWLIASLHASDNLFDNPLLNLARKAAWWAGGLGLLAGAGLGFALGRRRRRA